MVDFLLGAAAYLIDPVLAATYLTGFTVSFPIGIWLANKLKIEEKWHVAEETRGFLQMLIANSPAYLSMIKGII